MNHLSPSAADALTPLQRTFITLERTRGRLAAFEAASREPIAIVGMACRVPGADTPSAFWRLMRDGTDAITPVPADRWNHADWFGTDAAEPGRIATSSGGFIRNVDQFDAALFGISAREADGMDPLQRLLLEVSWEALETAGIAADGLQGKPVGVYIGATNSDYADLQIAAADPAVLDAHFASGIAPSVLSGRVSYLLGLQGPSLTVDTACSSSLVAVHLACQALRQGDCRMALAGGVNLILAPHMFVALSRAHMLAPDGRCKTFDAAADGFARGEGCGVVVLKRLSDAEADGDRVLALVRGSAVNQDGASSSLSAPNGPAQVAVIRQALERAGVQPREVGYIEAHGTGTQLGDPLEVGALGTVFGDRTDSKLLIGSVKTNIGHLEAAAGVAGLIKLVLSLRHGTIPAHLHFRTPSPHIPWSAWPLAVPVVAAAWPEIGGTRIGGVSAFGFSGTNAHVVVEQAREAPAGEIADGPVLIALSARDPAALAVLAGRLGEAVGEARLVDLCRTVNVGRAQWPVRATIAANTPEALRNGLRAVAAGEAQSGVRVGWVARRDPPRIAFLFTGQGVQYAGMARGLYDRSAVFRAALDRCAAVLAPLLERPLLDVMFHDGPALDRTEYTQPALFAVEFALSQLWAACGVTPAVVIGHSVGEYVAACLAGVFSLEDALRLIARRGRLMQSLPSGGAMAAIAAPERAVAELLGADVSVAAVNGPTQTVIAGARAAVRAACDTLAARGIQSVPLPVSHAFHSHLVDPVLDAFEATAREIAFAPPKLRLISNVTGALAEAGRVTRPEYWRQHMRQKVRFADGMRALAAAAPDVCIEIGPHPVLLAFAKASSEVDNAVLIPSLRRGQPDMAQFQDGVSQVFLQGARIDWAPLAEGGRVVDLPTYPFQRRRHWFKASPKVVQQGGHALLGPALPMAVAGRFYQSQLAADSPGFIGQHVARGRVVLPATAYLEMLTAAAAENCSAPWTMEDVTIGDAMVMPDPIPDPMQDGAGRVVQTVLEAHEAGAASVGVAISSRPAAPDGRWTRHVTAQIRLRSPVFAELATLHAARASCGVSLDVAAFYENLARRGMDFGPVFRGVRQLWRGAGENHNQCLGEVVLDAECTEQASGFRMHPVLLDGCLQVIAGAMSGAEDALFLPIAIGHFTLFGVAPLRCWSHVVVAGGDASRRATLRVFADDGRVVAALDDVVLRQVSHDVLARDGSRDVLARDGSRDALWRVIWRPAQHADAVPSLAGRRFLLLADEGGVADRLAGQLADARVLHADFLGDPEGATDIVDLRPLDASGIGAAWGVCAAAQALLRRHQSRAGQPLLWIVTAGGQSASGAEQRLSTAQAAPWGVARTLRLEHPDLRAVCVDLDPDMRAGWVEALRSELAQTGNEPERALRAGERLVPRLEQYRLTSPAASPDAAWRLIPATEGTFEHFTRQPMPRRAPGPGEVEIAVHATGLNFRDVLNVLGLYPGARPPLGGECAGVVLALGAGVGGIAVGDAVLAVGADCLASHVVIAAGMVRKLPDGVGMAEAASFAIAFVTAEFCLVEVGRLQAGERVLVHAGAGGVGMAAIRTALRIGARVFATAGSEAKRDLLRAMGVAHVFDSRSPAFAEQILAETGGQGVDLVLNALTGEMLAASFRTVAHGGRFIEIGKRGIKTPGEVAAMGRGISYSIVDWSETARDDPALIERVLGRVVSGLGEGRISPLPRHVFPLDAAPAAFRMMSQGRHVGRIVLMHPTATQPYRVRRDGTYLVTGGLGGLGLQVARWLGELGAGRLVLVGRRGMTAEATPLVADLRAAGTTVVTEALDVTNQAAMAALLVRLRREGPPVRGVVHAAAVLEDATILNQDADRFARVAAAKLGGAEVLDQLTRADPLDFFVLFSSIAGMLGAPGQANYAAANAALDVLANRRRRDGLAAHAIAWGAWAQNGMAANGETASRLSEHGLATLSVARGLGALERLLTADAPSLAVAPMDWPRYIARAHGGAMPALLSELAAPGDARPTSSRPASARSPAAPVAREPARLAAFVAERVAHALRLDASRPLDAQMPFSEMGLDSLLAIELRNTFGAVLDKKLPATLLFDHPTLAQLTTFLLREVSAPDIAAAPALRLPSRPRSSSALLEAVAELSDDEVERALAGHAPARRGA